MSTHTHARIFVAALAVAALIARLAPSIGWRGATVAALATATAILILTHPEGDAR